MPDTDLFGTIKHVLVSTTPVDSSTSRFIWYSTNVFDFERNHGDNLFIDKSSDKLIVSSAIRPGSRCLLR